MSKSPPTPDPSTSAPALDERLVAFECEDDAVVIYDECKHTAWLRSNDSVTVADTR